MAPAGCQSPAPDAAVPDSATAERLARAFYLTAHGSGVTVTGLSVRQSTRITFDGRDAWQVEIRGTVVDANGTSLRSAMILHVDAATGDVTIYAQG
jgi:hypothetical protein